MLNQPTNQPFVREAAPKRIFKREGKLEINPLLLQAFGITPEELGEVIKSAEEPEAMRDMFVFLSDYATLSESRTRLLISGDKLEFMVADLKRRMGRVAEVYRKQAEEHREFGYATASLLSKISDKARELSNFRGMSREDKVAFIDAVVGLEHTSGSIIPIAFGITDYGSVDYWPRKLLAFLRSQPGMVREGYAPKYKKAYRIYYESKRGKKDIQGADDDDLEINLSGLRSLGYLITNVIDIDTKQEINWLQKLREYEADKGYYNRGSQPGMVKEGTASDTRNTNIIFLPLEQAWKMRAKHAYPGAMESKRTREAMERLRTEMKQGRFEPIPATKEELSSGILTEGKHRLIVAKEMGIKQVPIKIIEQNGRKAKINWNLNISEGRIVYMPPEEYMERVNIFNRIGMSRVIEDERKAIGKGYRGIGYYPPLSERSYRSVLEGIRAGNEMDIPNIVYRNGKFDNQEGFHRALVARDLGIEKIPVLVIGEMPSVFIRALDIRWNENLTEQVKAINALKGKVIGRDYR